MFADKVVLANIPWSNATLQRSSRRSPRSGSASKRTSLSISAIISKSTSWWHSNKSMSLNQSRWASSTGKLTCSSCVCRPISLNNLRKCRREWGRCVRRACTRSDRPSTLSRPKLTLPVKTASLMSSSNKFQRPTIVADMPAPTHQTNRVISSRNSSRELSRHVLNRGGLRWTTHSSSHPHQPQHSQPSKITPEKRARPRKARQRRLRWRKRSRDQLSNEITFSLLN